MSDIDKRPHCDAFRILLRDCLKVNPRDSLVILYDEDFYPYQPSLVDVLAELPHYPTQIFLPRVCQERLADQAALAGEEVILPGGIAAALSVSTAVVNLLNGDLRTLPVRRAVLQHPRPDDARFAHIPGLSNEILDVLARSPLSEIVSASEITAWALGEAKSAELVTHDSKGMDHHLHLQLDGWDNEPFMSPGVFFPGSWGNIPPGESFSCPFPGVGSGSVCINGSVPGNALEHGEEVVLHVDNGKVVAWDGLPKSPGYLFFEDQKKRAAERRDPYWNSVAELGIGLNPVLKKLTGNPLFDEKAARSVHVAIGDNSGFGHSIRAGIHADLVCWEPTLQLDDVAFVDEGTLRFDEFRARRESMSAVADEIPSEATIFLRRNKVRFNQDRLQRRVGRAGRVGFVEMGNDVMAFRLAKLAKDLDTYDQVPLQQFVDKHPSFSDEPSDKLLRVLYHYRALGISRL